MCKENIFLLRWDTFFFYYKYRDITYDMGSVCKCLSIELSCYIVCMDNDASTWILYSYTFLQNEKFSLILSVGEYVFFFCDIKGIQFP